MLSLDLDHIIITSLKFVVNFSKLKGYDVHFYQDISNTFLGFTTADLVPAQKTLLLVLQDYSVNMSSQ